MQEPPQHDFVEVGADLEGDEVVVDMEGDAVGTPDEHSDLAKQRDEFLASLQGLSQPEVCELNMHLTLAMPRSSCS